MGFIRPEQRDPAAGRTLENGKSGRRSAFGVPVFVSLACLLAAVCFITGACFRS